MGNMGDNMGGKNVKITNGADFQYRKQERNPKYGTSKRKNKG